MSATRIFDLLSQYVEKFPSQDVALAGKVNKEWVKYSIQDYVSKANTISFALMAKGVEKGDKIGIVSSNRPEWNFFDMAIMQIACVCVPIYPTISDADYLHILNHAEIEYLFVDTKELVKKLKPIIAQVPHFKEIICLEDAENTILLDDFYKLGDTNPNPEELQKRKDYVLPTDLATMIYTSGTTGLPKGVMLSHNNLLSQLFALGTIPAEWSKTALSFLPLCHAYERILVYLYHHLGISVYYAENLGTIAENIKEVHPTMMSCVPRLLEKIYDKLYLSGKKLDGFKKTLYYWSFELAKNYRIDQNSPWYLLKHKIADKLIYSKWREAIGGNFDIVVSGGAAIQKQQAAFFNAIGMPVFEGYGLSETSPVIAVSQRGKGQRVAGTVGPPLPGVEIRIGDKNEIQCKGPNVMMGYYRDSELTAEVIDPDGWFHTGDTGKFENGNLIITGRLKNIFKTSFGKYVNPFLIEEQFCKSPFIENMVVFGENEKFAAALILPDFVYLKDYCTRHNIEFTDQASLISKPEVQAIYNREVKKFNPQFAHHEQIKSFELIADEWSMANGLLTPTLKVKRNMIQELYKDQIARLFA
ncbi:MAG TPA: long-chain fatty acid--CoA ligase [Bacteroidales bacterium]|nr:long-chain fatty acid--CoA ligase [Bacteroidales bacterium]